jgi:hypothetical protein
MLASIDDHHLSIDVSAGVRDEERSQVCEFHMVSCPTERVAGRDIGAALASAAELSG